MMSADNERLVAELKEKIRKVNIMINYHQTEVLKYKAEKHRLKEELSDLRDDFWEDDG